ncbi:MAG: DUF4905 domain-containing protein [Bacteroidota bacterium]
MVRKLTPIFSHSFSSNIWNIITDEKGQTMVLEIRDQENHQVSFSALDIKSKQLLIEQHTLEEKWWVGVTALYKLIVIFHSYEDSANPEIKKFYGYDLQSAEITWELDDVVFIRMVPGGMLVRSKDEDEQYLLIDVEAGTAQHLPDDQVEAREGSQGGENNNVMYPLHYDEENEYFATLKKFVETRTGRSPAKAIEYMEYQSCILISYYIYESEKLSNFLLISDLQGNIVGQEVLDTSLESPGLDTFFVMGDNLFFVREKKNLIGFKI